MMIHVTASQCSSISTTLKTDGTSGKMCVSRETTRRFRMRQKLYKTQILYSL